MMMMSTPHLEFCSSPAFEVKQENLPPIPGWQAALPPTALGLALPVTIGPVSATADRGTHPDVLLLVILQEPRAGS